MNWKREAEFRRLLSGQIKHLTKDGLETLAHIATTDMTEVRFYLTPLRRCMLFRHSHCVHGVLPLQSYKAVPALAVHKAKRVESTGPGRLHALRILDAIIAKSRQRHGSKDKFGAVLMPQRMLGLPESLGRRLQEFCRHSAEKGHYP